VGSRAEIEYLLTLPASVIEEADDAASLFHMMNGNTFTCGVLHLKDAGQLDAAAGEVKTYVMNTQWMCGFPDKLVILTLGDYVISCYGAEDLVDQFSGKIGEVYNVGGHNERPNIFIVKTIINQLHDRLQDEGISEDLIKHVADRLGHDRRYGIDPTKIKNDLGWYPETPFEKGIVLTIDWYLNHQEWMDHVTSGDYQNYYQDMYKNK